MIPSFTLVGVRYLPHFYPTLPFLQLLLWSPTPCLTTEVFFKICLHILKNMIYIPVSNYYSLYVYVFMTEYLELDNQLGVHLWGRLILPLSTVMIA